MDRNTERHISSSSMQVQQQNCEQQETRNENKNLQLGLPGDHD